MAKVNLAAPVAGISGKLGGSSFQNTQYGLQINRINKPVNPLVNKSSQYRQYWAYATKVWREIDATTRNTWLSVYPNNMEAFKAFVTRFVEISPFFGLSNFEYQPPLVSGWQFANVLNSPFGSNLRLSIIGNIILSNSYLFRFSIIVPTTEMLSIKENRVSFYEQQVIYSPGTILTEVVFTSIPAIPIGQQRYIQIAARIFKDDSEQVENIPVTQWRIG